MAWETSQGMTELTWRETGGPPVLAPTRQGFGSKLIPAALPPDLGRAEVNYAPEGGQCLSPVQVVRTSRLKYNHLSFPINRLNHSPSRLAERSIYRPVYTKLIGGLSWKSGFGLQSCHSSSWALSLFGPRSRSYRSRRRRSQNSRHSFHNPCCSRI